MKTRKLISTLCAVFLSASAMAQSFELTESGYFRSHGVDVMAFDDIYPEGHQGGVSVIMHGHRVATNGDLRLEATPGQWQPVPRQLSRKAEGNSITATLCYPDSSRHETGFNPIFYPELQLQYTVRVEAKGDRIDVIVDLDQPIPAYLIGKAGFNLEFFPGSLFGKPWLMDRQSGIYPQQPNSPLLTTQPNHAHLGNYHQEGKPFADIKQFMGEGGYSPIVADDVIAMPYAVGKKFTSRPDDPLSRLTVESLNGELKLFDGRMNHNNGWFVLRQEIKPGATRGAVHWVITPTVVKDWAYTPVVQTSQIGYHPAQPKTAVIETMPESPSAAVAQLVRIDADKEQVVKDIALQQWGHFLRYDYLLADFSDVKISGLYQVRYAGATSSVFRIAPDIMPRFELKKNPEKLYTIKSGNTVMRIDANNGARITSYTLNGKEVISQIAAPNQYGSTFWTSPQKEWNWPPVAEHDMMPYSVEQKGGTVIMTSQLSQKFPVLIRKAFKSDNKGGIDVTYTIINKSDKERKVAPWEITRVLADGSVMFDAPLESITPKGLMNFYKEGNHVRYDIDHVEGQNRKINADGTGWLTFENKELRLMKRFADLTAGQPAPDEAEIQVYVHQGNAYVELESQGAYTNLKPGEQIDWTVNWRLEANR